jgi:hypothetical protein
MLTRDAQQYFQAIEDPVVAFVLCVFLHTWVGDHNIKILKKLCAAAKPRCVSPRLRLTHASCIVPGGPPAPSSPPLRNLDAAIGVLLMIPELEVR